MVPGVSVVFGDKGYESNKAKAQIEAVGAAPTSRAGRTAATSPASPKPCTATATRWSLCSDGSKTSAKSQHTTSEEPIPSPQLSLRRYRHLMIMILKPKPGRSGFDQKRSRKTDLLQTTDSVPDTKMDTKLSSAIDKVFWEPIYFPKPSSCLTNAPAINPLARPSLNGKKAKKSRADAPRKACFSRMYQTSAH